MKIAIFTDTYMPEINGIVTSIRNFTNFMVENGHEVMVFCPMYKGAANIDTGKIKVKRYASFSFLTNKATKISFPSLLKVIDELKEFEPDVIHVQTPMNIGLTGVLAARFLKIKNIQTYHTYIPDFMVYLKPTNIFGLSKIQEEIKNSEIFEKVLNSDFASVLGNAKRGSAKWIPFRDFVKTRRRNRARTDLSTKFAWGYTRFLYNQADLVLTPSFALKTELEKHHITSPVGVQSNGIELSDFTVKNDYTQKNRIVHIGRLGPEKNVDVILKAFAIFAQENHEATLDIMGDGPSKKQLMKLAKNLKINHRVKFLGFVDRKDILQGLGDYDMFVTASTIETQGLVILEAMASGLPVVGVNKLAIPEVIKDSVNGYLIKPGDYKTMAKAMAAIVANEKLRTKMGEKSLKLVQEHELEDMAKKLESYYNDITSDLYLISK